MPRRYVAPKVERVDPDPVGRHRVKIIGGRAVFGHEPGTVATLEIRRSLLDVLILAGNVAAEPARDPQVGTKKKGNGDNVTPNMKEGE